MLGALYAYFAYHAGPLGALALVLLGILLAYALYSPVLGVAFAIVLMPLYGLLERAPEVFEVSPQLLPIAWTALILPVCVFRTGRESWRPPPLSIFVGAVALASVIGLGIAADTGRAAEILRFLILGITLFFLTTLTVRERSDAIWILRAIATAAILIGGLASYELFSGSATGAFFGNSNPVGRAGAGFEHPNFLGGFLLVTVAPVAAGLLLDRRLRWLHALAIVLSIAGIYASFSRGAILGLLIIPLVMVRGRWLVALVPLVVLIGAIALPDLVRERFASLEGSAEVTSRLDFWRTALSIFSENPVAGVGLGGFPDAYAEIRLPGKEFFPGGLLKSPPHAHSLPLNLLAELGLMGFVTFFSLIALAAQRAFGLRRNRDPWLGTMGSAMLATLLAFLVHNVVDVMLIDQGGTYLWVMLGLLSALVVIAERETRSSHSWSTPT